MTQRESSFLRLVAIHLRKYVREQGCHLPDDVNKFIVDNKLVVINQWPAWTVHLSEAGREFLDQHAPPEA